jgi:UDP-N-acetylglucosamine diphosphorylase/glucosamine-1-phosphate N-acetyltransferase
MNYIVFDDHSWESLLPLTFTRPVSEIRVGILTIREKWEKYLQNGFSFLTKDYLSKKYRLEKQSQNMLINGAVFPNKDLVDQVDMLNKDQALVYQNDIVAANLSEQKVTDFWNKELRDIDVIEYPKHNITKITRPWQAFQYNGWAIEEDFKMLTENRESQPVSNTNHVYGGNQLFLEPGAKMECAVINTTQGPVYIGTDAEIMEGSVVRGPLAMCEHSVLKMLTRIYGPTTIGPYCKVGGEINNSVLIGYSNKAHDGFLGNSVLGQWCNLGADTNNSNLKNNYAEVKLWNYAEKKFINTGQQFCGLIMGDHSKCGINTMFNTGTVVGVNANLFGEGFPRNFIPSFTWGGIKGYKEYSLEKALEVAEIVMKRRNMILDSDEKQMLQEIFHQTKPNRQF